MHKQCRYCTKANTLQLAVIITVPQGSATFCTSGPHPVLKRFQPVATIPADQKKKGFHRKFMPSFGRIDGEDQKEKEKNGSSPRDEDHFGGFLVHIYH